MKSTLHQSLPVHDANQHTRIMPYPDKKSLLKLRTHAATHLANKAA